MVETLSRGPGRRKLEGLNDGLPARLATQALQRAAAELVLSGKVPATKAARTEPPAAPAAAEPPAPDRAPDRRVVLRDRALEAAKSAPAANAWTLESLSALVDGVFGKGTARALTTEPLEFDVRGEPTEQHSAWRIESQRSERAREAKQRALKAAPEVRSRAADRLRSALFRSGVDLPGLYSSYQVTPRDRAGQETNPRLIAVAQRRANEFAAVLQGAERSSRLTGNAADMAREFLAANPPQTTA